MRQVPAIDSASPAFWRDGRAHRTPHEFTELDARRSRFGSRRSPAVRIDEGV